MPRFIEGQDRHQVTLLPESLDEFIAEDNAVRVVDAFVNELDVLELGFEGVQAAETGRPSYHPTVLLKIYSACPQCPMKAQCTPSGYRRISRWEHESVLEEARPADMTPL